MYGFYNKLLRINLTEKKYLVEDIPDAVFERYLGGKGLGAHLLMENIPWNADPLSADNRIVFAVGPVTDTRVWSNSRYGVFSKSPLTKFFGESYAGGKVAPQIKKCGYDAVILEGKGDKPVFLEISDKEVKFHDAMHIWGK